MPRISRPERSRRSKRLRWATRLIGSSFALCGLPKAAFAQASASEPTPLVLTLGVRAVHRSFEYHDPAAGLSTLLSQTQPLGPSAFLQAYLFPAAFNSRGALTNVGLAASYELGLPTTAVFQGGTPEEKKLTSHASELFLGLRGRLPLGAHELGLTAGYGQQRYTLSGDEGAPLVPDVEYDFARIAADASFRFDDLSLGARLGTRLVEDTGGLRRDWFPAVKTRSLEAGVVLGYCVAPRIEVALGFDLTRYWFDFNPIPKNADPRYVAGGAVDQYVAGWLGLRFSLEHGSAQ